MISTSVSSNCKHLKITNNLHKIQKQGKSISCAWYFKALILKYIFSVSHGYFSPNICSILPGVMAS